MRTIICLFIISCVIIASCSKKTAPVAASSGSTMAASYPSPPCIVYKTKADYSKYVPVALSDDKKRITSFPAVLDLKRNGQFTYPSQLIDGWLLDNRGIGPDVAFLKITYEEYNSNDQTPQAEDLFGKILDADPLLQMYNCGNLSNYSDPVRQINDMIRAGKLGNCIKLK